MDGDSHNYSMIIIYLILLVWYYCSTVVLVFEHERVLARVVY